MKYLASLLLLPILLGSCATTTYYRSGHMNPSDHMNTSMNGMMNNLENKTGDDLDRSFIENMIPHHQGAINMAKKIENEAKHEELRKLARDIIEAQQKEIEMMQKWQKEWWYEK